MIKQLWSALWNDEKLEQKPPLEPPPVSAITPVDRLRLHPEARLLKLLRARSFESLEALAEGRARGGLPVGRLIEKRVDANGRPVTKGGTIVDVRPQHYGNALAASCDYRLVDLEEAVAEAERALETCRPSEKAEAELTLHDARVFLAEAVRLMPVARRWALRRDLRAIDALRDPENALQGQNGAAGCDIMAAYDEPRDEPDDDENDEPAKVAGSSPNVPYAISFDETIRGTRRRRLEVEQANREGELARFQYRQTLLAGPAAPDVNDTTREKVRLIVALAEWDDKHPELRDEIARADAR